MNCGLITVPAQSGEWTLVLRYSSETATAESIAVKVPQP